LDMPAIVTVKEVSQNIYNLGQGQIATIQLNLINPGALPAENVSLVISTNGAISLNEADSIYIGTLLQGEETGIFTWTVNLAGTDYSRGVWTADIYSSNARTFPYSGSFVTPKITTPSTGGRLSSENVYCYPNPFNPDLRQTTLRYSLEKTAEVTIKIYDAGGNLVIALMEDVQQLSGQELSVGWDGRNGEGDMVSNGVYFFIIETSENERGVGKIAVLR
ncbi:MAG: T9SS type A sorting domain-containing protein, partial [Candidatus Zixiibacteriota bacterium]